MTIIENRIKIANILRRVLINELSVKDALLMFPDTTDDKSIMSAYHALVHYEADEDLRRRDDLYREEQDDYIENLSYILAKGNDLPENIIKNYEKYYQDTKIIHSDDKKDFWKGFLRFLNI